MGIRDSCTVYPGSCSSIIDYRLYLHSMKSWLIHGNHLSIVDIVLTLGQIEEDNIIKKIITESVLK